MQLVPWEVLAHHWIVRASVGVARGIMLAVNAMEAAARINLRTTAAFEIGIDASLFQDR